MTSRRLILFAFAIALLFTVPDPSLAQAAGSTEPELKIQRLSWAGVKLVLAVLEPELSKCGRRSDRIRRGGCVWQYFHHRTL